MVDGAALDTVDRLPAASIVENATLIELRAREAQTACARASAKARETFMAEQAERIVKRTGVTLDARPAHRGTAM